VATSFRTNYTAVFILQFYPSNIQDFTQCSAQNIVLFIEEYVIQIQTIKRLKNSNPGNKLFLRNRVNDNFKAVVVLAIRFPMYTVIISVNQATKVQRLIDFLGQTQ